MASAVSVGSRRLSKSSSMTYIEPRLGALAFKISDWPEMPTVCLTPGVSADDGSRCLLHDALGALDRGGVGHLHVEDQIALVLLRDEAGAACDRIANRSRPAGRRRRAARRRSAARFCRPPRHTSPVTRSKKRLKPRNNQPRPALTGRMMSQPRTPPTTMPGSDVNGDGNQARLAGRPGLPRRAAGRPNRPPIRSGQ